MSDETRKYIGRRDDAAMGGSLWIVMQRVGRKTREEVEEMKVR